MDLKISQLVSVGVLTGAELFEVVQVGVNKKTTLDELCDYCSAPTVTVLDVDNPIITGGSVAGNPTFVGTKPNTIFGFDGVPGWKTGLTIDYINNTGTFTEFKVQAPGVTINGGTDDVIISDKSNATITVAGEDAWIVEETPLAKPSNDPSSIVLEPIVIVCDVDGQTVFEDDGLVFAKAIALVMVESEWLDKNDDYIFTLGNDSIELAGAYSAGLFAGQKLKILITK